MLSLAPSPLDTIPADSEPARHPNPIAPRAAAMAIAISRMAAAVQPSATLAAAAKAKQLKAEGVTVFDFSLGEPDFPTPEHICQAAVKAMQAGHTRYTPAGGIVELRAAVARVYQKTYGIRYSPDQVVISCGAKHSLHNA